jgi:competence protein CoiA
MVVKAGPLVSPHFAHYGDRECSSDYACHPESPAHRLGKKAVARFMREQFQEYATPVIEYEVPVPEVKRVADVMITFPMGWRIACEVQLAREDQAQLAERTKGYAQAGIDTIWWLGKEADHALNRTWCINTFGVSYRISFSTVESDDTLAVIEASR